VTLEAGHVRVSAPGGKHGDVGSRLQLMMVESPEAAARPEGAPATDRRSPLRGPRPLLWRLFLVNAAVLMAGALLLALTPVQIHAPVRAVEVGVIAAALVAMAVVNLVLTRRSLAPLRELAALMQAVDPLEPGRRLTGVASQDAEIAALAGSFNTMLGRVEEERRDSALRALRAQEHERARVARELHDEVGQTLTAIALEAERAAEVSSEPDRAAWARVATWAQQSVEELRRIARRLRPEALDDLGLINSFIALCARISEQSGLRIERRLPDRIPPHSPDIDLVLYRVAQESLTNVMRHADATRALLSLDWGEDRIVLTVRDDGRGFSANVGEGRSAGLAGMRERAMLVGGDLSIESRPGEGTEVRLEIRTGR
jgi:two-component system, NarL family, sensor histidine kinase UhpB